jgi:Zn-dependent metalloprotease
MRNPKYLYPVIVALIVLAVVLPVKAFTDQAPPGLVETLVQQTDGTVSLSYHTETGKVRFIGTEPGRPIAQPQGFVEGATAEQAAQHFMSAYGPLFGLTDASQELAVLRSRSDDAGRAMVRFQQVYQGIPVVGGEIIVNMDAARNVTSANGEVLPDLAIDTAPVLSAEAAQQIALAKVSREYGLAAETLAATPPELWIYNPMLMGGPGIRLTSLVWRMEVSPVELSPVRELVLVDARIGLVVLSFNQIDAALHRRTYTANNGSTLPGTLVCEDPTACTYDDDATHAHTYAGHTYNFYATNHGRDSIDDKGMIIVSTVHFQSGYANAFWNGQQMVYGDAYGFADADDVIAHELTHGVTDYESSLFYYYQSGAINEAFSDIWGEFVDQTNGAGNDDASVKWLMGEDVTGMGAIRSMSNPPAYGDPDRVGSANYQCDTNEQDRGGVHTNSGVVNKAAYLMVDGGTFNSKTVTGLGLTKTAKIFYNVQVGLLTTAGDFKDLYDGLQQACKNLIGSSGITAADCAEVKDALDAVEMNTQPASCPAPEAQICPAGQKPFNVFFESMEYPANTSARWSIGPAGASYWYYPQNPNILSQYGFDATYATSGKYNFFGFNMNVVGDYYIAMVNNVQIPAGVPYMRFRHAHGFDDDAAGAYDGGVLEYSINGGAWTDAGSLFIENGYNGTIATGYSNPLAGRSAFVRESNGYISSRLNLTTLANQPVRFRFRVGTDNQTDDLGWFVDDIQIYTCGAVPTPNIFFPLVRKLQGVPGPTTVPPTPTATATLPPSTGPQPGYWVEGGDCPGCSELYVTTDRNYVDNFAIYISVSGCGDYKITHMNPEEPISSNQFSFSGSFYANGTFTSQTSVSGSYGLSGFYIPGCGTVSGGPFSYVSSWSNSSQPDPDVMEDVVVEPVTDEPGLFERLFQIVEVEK